MGGWGERGVIRDLLAAWPQAGPALLTGFPMLLMSNCRGTPFGTFFSTVSTTAGTEVAAGGCRVQAEGGLYGVSVSDQDATTANSHSNNFSPGRVCLVLLLTPAGSWLWDCQWRWSGYRCC